MILLAASSGDAEDVVLIGGDRPVARRIGRVGDGRDEPRADEQDQGQVAGRREEAWGTTARPPGRESRQLPQPHPAARADLSTGVRHPGGHRRRAPLRRPGRAARHRVRDRGDLRVLRGGAQELGGAARRPCGAAERLPLVSTLIRFPPIRWLSSLLIGLANRIIGASDEGEEGMPRSIHHRLRAEGHGRRGARGESDRTRRAHLHPLHHRLRRHRRPRR